MKETGDRLNFNCISRLIVTIFKLDLEIKVDIPESFVGAGDNGGAESFIGVQSEDSAAISFDASQSDFLFSEPMAGFV